MHDVIEPDESMVGSTLCDTYKLVASLGTGAMGTVYEAEHLRLKRTVAVKILAERFRDHVPALKRFHNEARALVMLDNPHVVRVLDFALSGDGRPFLVMERLQGTTVGKYLELRKTFSLASTISVAQDVCHALVEAHSKGIFHRDLKPDNLFLVDVPGGKEFVKVLDFGVSRVPDPDGSRVTSEREVLGTPEYMSPEQALGLSDRVNGRADQHGLALVMYEMLSGVSPFAAEDVESALEKVSFEMPALLDQVARGIPRGLSRVLHRALSKDPGERFPGIDVFLDAARSAAREAEPRSTVYSTIPIANDTVRVSMPVAKAQAGNDPVRTVALLLGRTRAALLAGDLDTATELANVVLDSAALTSDDAIGAVFELGRSLLEQVFTARLEPVERRVTLLGRGNGLLTQAQAALLKSPKPSATIAELVHSVPLPRVEALRALVDLEAQGAVEFVGVPRPRSFAPVVRSNAPPSAKVAAITLKRA
ncbi:MAG TPA: serine/threonine-protein kinase [Polyangiaceae bacterium]|jgi:serine/threonine-protein kinase|nr:serine/threonine-protein kinase [Polyangiaceae bacterium]